MRKKGFFCALISLLIVICLTISFAETKLLGKRTSGKYEYEYYSDGTATISSFINYEEKSASVPIKIDGFLVTEIGNSAFTDCPNLTSVTIPESIVVIGECAFANCFVLPSIAIPDSVEEIKQEAFLSCYSLTSINIPDSVTKVGANPFYECTKLKKITVSKNHPTLAVVNGVLFDKVENRLITYPVTKNDTEYSIPKGTKIIGYESFYGNGCLTSVTIPNSVTEICGLAFCGVPLKTVNIPGSVKKISDSAFFGTSLKTVKIQEGVVEIGECAFADNDKLTSVTLPSSLTQIDDCAFEWCPSVMFKVNRNSYAAEYCERLGFAYQYVD